MQSPKFSIIVPMYNVEKFIARALESAINQSFKDIEIICVDDCGQDKSIEIAKEFAKKDERIKIVQNERNLGTFAARNNGALSAQGEYLLFLDSDDFLELKACEILNDTLLHYKKQNICLDILGFNYRRDSEMQDITKLYHSTPAHYFHFKFLTNKPTCTSQQFLLQALTQSPVNWTLCNKTYRKSCYIKSLKLFDFSDKLVMAEDVLAFFTTTLHCKTCAQISPCLYVYCTNPNSTTQDLNANKLKNNIQNQLFVRDKIIEICNKFGDLERILGQICSIILNTGVLNQQRVLKKSFFTYLTTSLYKKYLRYKEKGLLKQVNVALKVK